ncbi:MAG: DUF5063 domain-containing protein [Bacteroidetes bacterium]|nr:DUF5063 domain-containing protein [Bacteroidota bacterium]MCL6102824.1 DUF5063 domain-containing protein [Bacteroidota bacterium]
MEQTPKNDSLFPDVVFSRNVIEFATVANEFCTFTESVSDLTRKDFLGKLQKLLPLLYLKASLLPELDEEEDSPEKFVSESDYNFILRKLSSKLGEFDSYPEIFEPGTPLGEANVEANISENVADIYQDLKDFILSYRIGTVDVMRVALWECKNNFEQYWGQKLVNGLRAVHMLVYGNANIE